MLEDEYCTKCGIDNDNGFAMTISGYSYCPECWYYVMNLLYKQRDDGRLRGDCCEDFGRGTDFSEEIPIIL